MIQYADLVVGLSSEGRCLLRHLGRQFPTIGIGQRGRVDCRHPLPAGVAWPSIRFMNVFIPYSRKFVQKIRSFQQRYRPSLTIVYSRVPVGTTSSLPDAVHSSVIFFNESFEGKGFRAVVVMGGKKVEKAAEYLKRTGIECACFSNSEITESVQLAQFREHSSRRIHEEFVCQSDHETALLQNRLASKTRCVEGLSICREDAPLSFSQESMPLPNSSHEQVREPIIWHPCNIYKSAIIGNNVSIGMFTEIGHNVIIGNNARIGAMAFIPEGVIIEDNTWIGPRCTFSNDRFPPSPKEHWQTTIVKKGARLGAAVCVLPGLTIGEEALIGMGSVVTKSVPDGEIWCGVPAVKIRKLKL